MVGHIIQPDNKYWRLYKKLRALIHLITAPVLKYSNILQVETLITEFNDVCVMLFGRLKPKFHLLLHYYRQL